ncbi:FHA domain-containing protein [Rhizobium terrae]|uniref:FHA domain-containing protein n=1 Tax=Rhizobium terrae TaxID=2171756 RepID=UPI000E3CF906|nr:FHA domain-containing protein [Rhizobium terrae]
MRLELRSIPNGGGPPASRQKWFFERGRRTLGRAPDCDWQLPEDVRSVSKLHCTIERDRAGFLLRDQSANGSRVDGIVVHEGEVVRLADQSRLEVGGLAFSVHISGEEDREIEDPDAGLAMSDEPLTISAILSDIAPGGRTATGILGERMGDDWPPQSVDRKQGVVSSRNVEIGWVGPPEIRSATNVLPVDWNSDTDSDYGSHLEHGSATHVSVPLARAKAVEAPQTVNDNVPQAEPADFPTLVIGRSAELADRLEPLIGRMEEAVETAFGVFEMEGPSPQADLDFFGHGRREEMLLARVEVLLGRQVELKSALETLVHETSRLLEPRIIEAKVDAARRPLPWLRQHGYWQAYRMQFEKDGKPLSVREFLRETMKRPAQGATYKAFVAGHGGDDAHEE